MKLNKLDRLSATFWFVLFLISWNGEDEAAMKGVERYPTTVGSIAPYCIGLGIENKEKIG